MNLNLIRLIFGLFSLILLSCNSKVDPSNIVGNYVSKKYDKFQEFCFHHGRNKILATQGSKLFIKPDSTYIMKTCGNVIAGRWRLGSNDTLLLYWKNNFFIVDKVEKFKDTLMPSIPEKYQIESNGELRSSYTNGTVTSLDDFVKVKE